MSIRDGFGSLPAMLALLLAVMLFATAARGQDSESASTGAGRDVAVGTENAVLRARIVRLEEQQKAFLDLICELQRPSEQPAASSATAQTSATSTVLVRFGTSYTRSAEDRFTNLNRSNPENLWMEAINIDNSPVASVITSYSRRPDGLGACRSDDADLLRAGDRDRASHRERIDWNDHTH